jgi:hypothetical protein
MPIFMNHRSKEYWDMRMKEVEQINKRTKLPPAELAKRKAELVKKLQSVAN